MTSESAETDNPDFPNSTPATEANEKPIAGILFNSIDGREGTAARRGSRGSVHFNGKDQVFPRFPETQQEDQRPSLPLTLSSRFQHELKRKLSSDVSSENGRIWINLVIVGLGTMGMMSAYDMVRYIESSLNKGLGTASLAANYSMLILCVLLAPTLLIKKLGSKWTLVLSILLSNIYYAAHYFPDYATMIPGGMVMGISLGLVHPCSNTYVTQLANAYARLNGLAVASVINYFFGILMFIQFLARCWGNLTSAFLLTPSSTPTNDTRQSIVCGANYCPNLEQMMAMNSTVAVSADSPNSPTGYKAYILYGCAMGTALASALLVAIFLENREKMEAEDEEMNHWQQTMATFRLMKHPKLLMIILITVFLGLVEAYMTSDYTKAFVTCSLGIHHVGFVVTCYGIFAAIFSYIFGWMANHTGRVSVFLIAALVSIASIFAQLYWVPDPKNMIIFYVLAGSWGIGDAVWRPQLYALYGFLFPHSKEAAFGNLEVWQSTGLVIGYIWHEYICISTKLYIMLGVLAVGMTAYLCMEFRLWASRRNSLQLN